jgi:hypothetical protein
MLRSSMENSAADPNAGSRDRESFSTNRSSRFGANACRYDLWHSALECIGPLDISPEATHFLRRWIAMGVERMQATGCLSPGDLTIATSNIKTFIHLMKTEALVQGHAERLDMESLHAAHRQLERKGRLTAFTLWPFWPHELVASDWTRRPAA